MLFLFAVAVGVAAVALQAQYTLSLRSPLRIRFQWPRVIAAGTSPRKLDKPKRVNLAGG